MAFLDIMPLTRGHVLVITREHHETLGGVGVDIGREVSITFILIQYNMEMIWEGKERLK